MAAPTQDINLVDYEGKEVSVVIGTPENNKTANGTVGKATEHVMFLKMRGGSILVEKGEIVSIKVTQTEKPKRLEIRYLAKPINTGNVLQHLADRHGIPMDLLPKNVDAALGRHNELHKEQQFSHAHGPKPTRRGLKDIKEVAERAAALEQANDNEDEFAEDYVDED